MHVLSTFSRHQDAGYIFFYLEIVVSQLVPSAGNSLGSRSRELGWSLGREGSTVLFPLFLKCTGPGLSHALSFLCVELSADDGAVHYSFSKLMIECIHVVHLTFI